MEKEGLRRPSENQDCAWALNSGRSSARLLAAGCLLGPRRAPGGKGFGL